MKRLFYLSLALLLGSCASGPEVGELTVEQLTDPEGLETAAPRLGWKLRSSERDVRQRAYRIVASSSPERLAAGDYDLWDTGRVESDETLLIPYAGKPLASLGRCWWNVEVWTDRQHVRSEKPGYWSAALSAEAWQADWIGLESVEAPDEELHRGTGTRLRARYLRREIELRAEVRRAVLSISGLGVNEAYVNGERVGRQVLSPTPTDYGKRVCFRTFDVTPLLRAGRNTLGAILGNGRFLTLRTSGLRDFGLPRLLAQLEVEYTDGSRERFTSDSTWRATIDGPLGCNNEFDGEEYDARREMAGWSCNGFDDSRWPAAETMAAPAGELHAQENPDIHIMDSLRPVRITPVGTDRCIVDMGQNMTGWLRIRVRGERGRSITLRFAEQQADDTTLYTANLRTALATDRYTLGGNGTEVWEPRFVYHGFRYVEITGWPGLPAADDLTGMVIYDRMPSTGTFACSDRTLNAIHRNAWWGIRGNYRGMPTDCPQRDERMGWLGDRTAGAHGESFLFANRALYAKWLQDIEDSQRPDGSLPDIAPNYWEFYTGDVTWPAAYFTVADMLFEQFGDRQPILRHYASFDRYMEYIRREGMRDGLVFRDTFGDWCMPPESPELIHSQDPARKTSGELLASAFYYRLTQLMQKFARIAGRDEDIARYAACGEEIAEAFHRRFYDPERGCYDNNTVTANLLPLMHGMTPPEERGRVFERIAAKTRDEFGGHVSTGLIGIQWLMRGLTEGGYGDLAYRIAANRDYPSWGYMIDRGATTVWELWNGDTADPAMNSGNHVMLLGDLLIWYYEYLAGIRTAPGKAYAELEMRPRPAGDLRWVDASYESVRGTIRSSWERDAAHFRWQVSIPANCRAELRFPGSGRLSESGREVDPDDTRIRRLEELDGDLRVAIGSGDYAFVLTRE